jgi:hypothetical protein
MMALLRVLPVLEVGVGGGCQPQARTFPVSGTHPCPSLEGGERCDLGDDLVRAMLKR